LMNLITYVLHVTVLFVVNDKICMLHKLLFFKEFAPGRSLNEVMMVAGDGFFHQSGFY